MATRLAVSKPCGLKILYVCPATMSGNVMAEFRHWSPQRSVVNMASQSKIARRALLEVMAAHNEYVVIINYEAWRKDLGLIDDLIKVEFDTIVIDEAHNVKDIKSIAYRGVKRLISEGEIPFIVPMTGSPILNKPQELFSLLTLVDPGSFWNERHFLDDYCYQDPDSGKWSFRPGGLDSLAKRITPQFLRRTKEQAGIELPPKTITVHEIEIDEQLYPEQARCRNEMRKWGSIILDADEGKSISATAIIAMYTRLRQIETWPDGIKVTDPKTKEIVLQINCNESQKLDEVISVKNVNDPDGLLPELVADERVVVFSQFKEPLHEIQHRCETVGIRSIILDGDTPHNIREEIRIDFDNRTTPDRTHAKYDVVLCNYKVGGIGLNFTAATQMIILDEEWNPGKRDQAYDRIHRIGQDKPVTIHVLRCKNAVNQFGIDVWLAGLIDMKEDMVQGFNMATDMAAQARDALGKGLI